MSNRVLFKTALTDNDSSAKENLGAIRWEGDKSYQYVKVQNATVGTVAGLAGNCVVWLAVSGLTSFTVCTDYTDGDGVGAGILQAAVAGVSTTAEYVWIQKTGPATLTTNVTAGAVGNALTAVGAGNTLLNVSSAVTDCIVATLIDATSGAQIVLAHFPG